jgi:hypothetical protein
MDWKIKYIFILIWIKYNYLQISSCISVPNSSESDLVTKKFSIPQLTFRWLPHNAELLWTGGLHRHLSWWPTWDLALCHSLQRGSSSSSPSSLSLSPPSSSSCMHMWVQKTKISVCCMILTLYCSANPTCKGIWGSHFS